MRHRRQDVVAAALRVLDDYGLADLSMRRLATELEVQPSALYHHFPSKQALLAAVADEILARGSRPLPDAGWQQQVRAACHSLRDSCLAYRDGAELVATVRAFGLGGRAPYDALVGVLGDGGVPDELAAAAARTLLHYVLGHATDEQTQRQADSAGAIDADPGFDHTSYFETGLDLILAGLDARVIVRPDSA